jgi:hypothetical protein
MTRRTALALFVALVVLGLGLLLGWNVGGLRDRFLGGAGPSRIDSLAVLPLENLSGDPEQEYFADGITEALITDLTKIGAMTVISRNSAMRYKDSDQPVREIARELQFRSALRTSPNFPLPRYGLWTSLYKKGMHEEAVKELKVFFAAVGDREVEEAMTRGSRESGYQGALRLAAETLETRSRVTYVKPFMIATLYAWGGKKDQAFQWLERAIEARDHDMVYLSVHLFPDSVREDSRFQDFLRRMNLPD